MKIKVLLLGTKESCSKLQMHLRDDEITVVGNVSDENKVIDEISRKSPDIMLITDTSPVSIRICHQIYLLRPRCIPVILADVEDIAVMQKLMGAGVHNIISPDINPINLVTDLKGIFSKEANRILTLENTVTSSSKSKVLMIFGAKDGTGKSTLAVNLGAQLASLGNKVAILDFDLQFGDIGALLGINPKGTIVDLLQEQSNPNADMIRQFLSIHLSGINYLAAPKSPEEGKMVSTAQVERIVAALRVYYDYLILDVPSGFDDISATCIDISSRILLLSGSDIPSLRDTKKCLSILLALTNQEKINLVMGKVGESSLRSRDGSAALGLELWGEIPYDGKTATKASNQGNLIVKDAPKSRLSKAYHEIAEKIDTEDGPKQEKGKKAEISKLPTQGAKSSSKKSSERRPLFKK